MENANFQPEPCSKMITSQPVVHSTINSPASSSGLVQLLTSSPTKPVPSPILMAQFGDSKSSIHHVGASTSSSVDSSLSQLTSTTVTFPCVQNVDEFSSCDALASRTKRRKLEEKTAESKEIAEMRVSIAAHHRQSLRETKMSFTDHISELFYLQSGYNAMDFLQWRKKPYPEFVAYLKYNSLESDEEEVATTLSATVATTTTTTSTVVTTNTAVSLAVATTSVTFQQKSVAPQTPHVEVKVPSGWGTPVAVSTTLPAAVSQLTQGIGLIKPKGGRHGMVFGNHQPLLTNVSYSLPIFPGGTPLLLDVTGQPTVTRPSITTSSSLITSVALTTTTSSVKSPTSVVPTLTTPTTGSTAKMNRSVTVPPSPSVSSSTLPASPSRLQTRLHSISAVYDSTIGSQEEIAERAKQEAYVMQRVAELRKEGVWSAKRLPKVQEPQRNKAHWDYLLEEMSWLASDFSQERKWKKSSAKKLVKMCQKYHVENKMKEERAEKEVELKLRRMASAIAKEIKQFWSNVEKFVEYKQQSRLDLKRKKVLDLQLNFIVDQTEKYSTWVAEGMNKSVTTDNLSSQVSSEQISGESTPLEHQTGSDGDFEPSEETSDDEETIAKAEQDDNQNEEDRKTELDLLEKESLVPLEELLESLPTEYLEGHSDCKPSDIGKLLERGDSDFEMKSGDECSDDESTMEAEEAAQGTVDYIAELDQLKEEGDMSIEDLVEMYKGVYDKVDSDDSTEEDDDDDNDDSAEDSSDEKSESMSDGSCLDIGLESLVDLPSASGDRTDSDLPTKEISDIAAAAESFKPKGYTYSTAKVAVKVPHLLKHQLREYQHIGLDWLVTMYERKLNGILADEMGLGKTIQTISLLAYLACEKGNWGPHLIVVPTSVMLNWEMEFKKWCPGFKILTYYGNPKERKQKRQGWTKPNTFHVCITSYKLVIQDHQSFRRKKWKYFILDEAQNIKNFKSQRWHLLLNFKSHRRLLLTGTPLQNSLMELWSLMHFLMPNVFLSHQDFKEWFANPVSGMIEGSHEYNKELINRLHKVLRPFLLRRLKSEVEKQLPGKYEHVVMCRLSKRQRYLYEDFMSQAKTKETLANGHYLSVINVLMQLRKVCNHPNLFESRPIVSPFQMEGIVFNSATLASTVSEPDPFKIVDLSSLNLLLVNLEMCLTAFASHRIKRFQTPKRLIEEIDDAPELPPKCPAGKIKLHVRTTSGTLTPPTTPRAAATATPPPVTPLAKVVPTQSNGPGSSPRIISVDQTSRLTIPQTASITTTTTTLVPATNLTASVSMSVPTTAAGITTNSSNRPVATSYTLQLVQPQSNQSGNSFSVAQITPSSAPPFTVRIQQTQQGPRLTVPPGQLAQLMPGYAQIVQTATGQYILSTSSAAALQSNATVQSAGFNQRMTTPTRVTVSLSSGSTNTPVTLQAKTGALNSSLSDSKASANPSKPILRVTPMKPSFTTASTSATATLSTLTSPSLTSSTTTVATRTTSDSSKPTTRQQSRTNDDTKHNNITSNNTSQFHLEALVRRKQQHRKERLERLARLNTKRCDAAPVFGSDLIEAVTVIKGDDRLHSSWKSSFRSNNNSRHANRKRWDRVSVLDEVLLTPEECLQKLKNILTRFSFVVPSVIAPEISFHVSHPPPWRLLKDNIFKAKLRSELSQTATYLHPLTSSMSTQFPDARLIQYDCGKLQTLDKLLRNLKTEGRRALIFTQMKRMLDILEQFLNYHGHIYLRLDGDTKVDQRLALMERFNADRRIFCFILSTRSGGVGVNLTGADTVIFYDSDWNPTMDAQAQDRCHRIGQTRDVHVYKLISERTVEENILMKANQKRLLGEVAIEGGNFTTAFFKKITVQKLFEVNDDGLKSLCKAPVEIIAKADPILQENVSSGFDNISNIQLENALANAEEDLDIQAAKSAKKEADLELVEFDESVPYDGDGPRDDDACKMEEELGAMMAELTPIQRYAMNFLESTQEPFSLEQLKQAEEEIEAQKKDWELGRLQVLKEEEERRAQLDDNELLFTYSREDTLNQVFISANTGELMPTWAPPTPPQDDSDVYIDYSTCFLYEPTIMPESQLPPVYVRKDHKRIRMDHSVALAKKQKVKKDDSLINIPRSLFDRPSAAILKMRKDAKMQRFRTLPSPTISAYKPPVVVHKPMVEAPVDSPEWIIHEDWALLQAVQTLLELPLNLIILSPGHIPNWDLVADVVNATSRIYRSPKHCRVRYETVIIPREEGKILYDINPNKPKKSKGIYRTKNNRPMKSSQLFVQDNNSSFTQIFHQRFDTIKSVANKRMPTLRPSIVNTGTRNPKHTSVLAENNINIEKSLTPVEIATLRQERINKEKEKQKKDAVAAVAAQNGELQATVVPQALAGASSATTPTLTPISGLQLASRPQAVNASSQQVLTVSQQQLGPGHPVIGQITAQQLQSVIGRIAVTTSGLAAATVTTSVRPQRAPTALVMHDLLGGNQMRNVVPQTVVSMTNVTGGQAMQQVVVSASPRVTPTAVVTNIAPGTLSAQVVSSPGKSPTAAQLQLYTRNQTLYKQRLQAAQQQHQVTTITVQQQSQQPQSPQQNKVPVSVTSLLSPNVATVQLTASQQQQLRNQAVTRTITEAEVTQLIKRQHLQQLQQQKANAATQGATQGQVQQQLLSTAQLQQLQQQQQQQQQQAAVAHAAIATGQNSFATLVKTVSTPSTLGTGSASPTVTIPVGMNINVKGGVATSKNVIVAHQQQQVEQLKLQQQQQQILQQRKLIQQQKLAQLSQAKTAIGTVQIVPQISTGHKAVPTTVTVQQIQQVMKQAQSQGQQLSTITTTSNLIPGTQTLPHTFLTKTGQVTIASPTTVTTALQARVVPLGHNVTAVVPSGLSQTGGSPRQTIQVVTATPHCQLRIPSTTGSTFTIDASRTQTVNVVSTTGFPLSTPTLSVTLPGNSSTAQGKDTANFDDTNSQGQ